jgi:signal transduction histidine kinase
VSRPVLLWRHVLNAFWKIAGAVSVRTKMVGIILGVVFVLGFGITLIVRQTLQEVMLHELELRAESVVNDLASRSTDLILVNNQFALHHLIAATQANHPDIRYIFILDEHGYVLVHTFGSGFPAGLLPASGQAAASRYISTTEGEILDVSAPIFNGRSGTAHIGFSDLFVRRAVSSVTSQILLATLLVSTAGVAAAIGMTWLLTRPILQLSEAARAVGEGDLQQRVPRWANDELGDLADAFNTMVAYLERAAAERREREQLRAELVERVISAQEDERRRIARDLHDQTSQSLVSLIVQLKLVEGAQDDENRQERLAELRDQLRQVLGDVRRMALDLRPGVLDDLGLVEAIRWFAERCCQDGEIQIQVTACDPCNSLPAREAVALYRVAQEGLSNIVRHSQARHAWINLSCDEGCINLEIRDDGIGFERPGPGQIRGGMGLFGMQERVQLLGGTLEINGRSNIGSCIRACVPWPQSVIQTGEN